MAKFSQRKIEEMQTILLYGQPVPCISLLCFVLQYCQTPRHHKALAETRSFLPETAASHLQQGHLGVTSNLRPCPLSNVNGHGNMRQRASMHTL